MDLPSRSNPSIRRRRAVAILVLALLVVALLVVATASAEPTTVLPGKGVGDWDNAPDWTQQINGYGTSWDAATSALADASGVYVGGWAGNASGDWDATLARYTTRSVQTWFKRYDGPAHKNDLVWKLAKGPGGTIYGVGWTVAANGKTDMLVIKWKSNGARVWAKTYDGSAHGDDAAMALGVDKYGGVVVAGNARGANGSDFAVVKWSTSGARQWVYKADGAAHADDGALDILVESAGSSYITGGLRTAVSPDKFAAYTVRLTAAGKKTWARNYLGASSLGANAFAIAKRPAGGVYVAGWSQGAATGKDAMIMRYTSTGSGQVLPRAASAGDDAFSDVAVTTTGFVAGSGYYTSGFSRPTWNAWSSETSTPTVLGFYPGPMTADSAYTMVQADAFGGLVVAGYARTGATQARIVTARYSTHSWNAGFWGAWGPALNVDQPAAIAIGGATVYVAGVTANATEAWNQVIMAYIY